MTQTAIVLFYFQTRDLPYFVGWVELEILTAVKNAIQQLRFCTSSFLLIPFYSSSSACQFWDPLDEVVLECVTNLPHSEFVLECGRSAIRDRITLKAEVDVDTDDVYIVEASIKAYGKKTSKRESPQAVM